MTQNSEPRTAESGLLAYGSSSRWDISVDESPSGEWSLELDGSQTYLVFQLCGLEVLQDTFNFLSPTTGAGDQQKQDRLVLGTFGSTPVSLLRDNEDFPRYFLLVGPVEKSAIRLNFDEEDIGMIRDALSQVLADLER